MTSLRSDFAPAPEILEVAQAPSMRVLRSLSQAGSKGLSLREIETVSGVSAAEARDRLERLCDLELVSYIDGAFIVDRERLGALCWEA